MKPNWAEAPDWANFLISDTEGKWYWIADATNVSVRSFQPIGGTAVESTLEERPNE
jgi:hypothetical protein